MKPSKLITIPLKWLLFPYISSAKSIYESQKNAKNLLGTILDSGDKSSELVLSQNQTFQEAVNTIEKKHAKNGINFNLDDVYNQILLKKRIILFGIYICWLIAITLLIKDRVISSVLLTLLSISSIPYLFVIQFRMWQISNKRLSVDEQGSIYNFINESNWIWLCLTPNFKKTWPSIIFIIASIVFLFSPMLGYAADLNDLSNAANKGTDLSKQALVTLFGEVANNPLSVINNDSSDTFIAQIFKIFGATLLIIATSLGGYISLKKVAHTAHDGQFMDQQQHSLWMPIRVLSGFSMLVPMSNGWSLSQLIMLYGASVVGVGGANLATEAALDSFMNGQHFVMQPASPSTDALSHAIFKSNLCMHGINASLDKIVQEGGTVFDSDYVQPHDDGHNGYILKSASFSCGGAILYLNDKDKNWGASVQNDINTYPVLIAQSNALSAMQNSLSEAAAQFVNAIAKRQSLPDIVLPNAESAIQSASQAYENTVTSALRDLNSNAQLRNLSNQISGSIKEQGWWSLGSWYQNLAIANTRISGVSDAKARGFGPDSAQEPDSIELYASALRAYLTQQSITTKTNSGVLTANSTFESVKMNDDPVSWVLNTAFQNGTSNLLNWISVNDSQQVNPLIAMKDFGDRIMGISEAGLAAHAALSATLASASNGIAGFMSNVLPLNAPAGVKAAYDAIGPFIHLIILALFSASFVLAIYLPMQPFLIWFAACINWLIIVGEAIFAAPLWALTHLNGEGEGMGSKTAHGYIFLLNVMIRPILMVGGFFLGGGIVIIGGTLLNKVFPTTIANIQFDSTTGIVQMIGFLILYCSAAITLVNLSFCLIHVVPDQVINWVGGHISSTLGRDMDSKANHSTNVLANKSESVIGSGSSRSTVPRANNNEKNTINSSTESSQQLQSGIR
ncbi:DotA/TraY family protein [Xenorhabdus nematophila]|uniref:DotA/TraY family protein n=1 Tax=Xenorhabdus nematophila TaxID=628 RepID=UPI0032B826F2